MKAQTGKTRFVCQQCGHDSQKWVGKCPSCGGWNTFAEEVLRPEKRSARASAGGYAEPKRLSEITSSSAQRLRTGIGELDRVLGGGIVPGSLILIGGDPGIGKSTLTLQLGEQVARQGTVTLYVVSLVGSPLRTTWALPPIAAGATGTAANATPEYAS